ncbi:hypothetical protein KR026_008614 [Drosophila bipectinata]|nr:hypothetical protein KR026_008614 [Drosophila bipectinata]
MRGLDLGFGTGGDGCGGGLLPTPTTTIQYKPQHLSESLAEFRLNAGAAVFKPLRSRGGGVGEGVPAGMGQGEGEGVTEGEKNEDYAITEGSAVLEGEATTTGGDGGDSAGIEVGGVRGGGDRVVAGVRGGRGLLALPGLLPAPHPLPLQTHLTHGHPHLHPHLHVHPPHPHAHAHAHAHAHLLQRLAVKQNIRYRKQPLPDLFHAVIALMRDQSRSVSYPEIINALSVRLQRPEVELKRHVPHTLHAAVNNGYLRKDGNRYSLLTEIEQVEIMRRNQQTAERAKELEKEPLSWRKR